MISFPHSLPLQKNVHQDKIVYNVPNCEHHQQPGISGPELNFHLNQHCISVNSILEMTKSWSSYNLQYYSTLSIPPHNFNTKHCRHCENRSMINLSTDIQEATTLVVFLDDAKHQSSLLAQISDTSIQLIINYSLDNTHPQMSK